MTPPNYGKIRQAKRREGAGAAGRGGDGKAEEKKEKKSMGIKRWGEMKSVRNERMGKGSAEVEVGVGVKGSKGA